MHNLFRSVRTAVTPILRNSNRKSARLSHIEISRTTIPFARTIATMDGNTNSHSQTMDELTQSLASLGLPRVPSVPDTTSYPTLNQIDIYRSHITECLEPITGAPTSVIYPALQWTQTLEYGDLMLPVPALRLKGKKPDALAAEIAEKVGYHPAWYETGLT